MLPVQLIKIFIICFYYRYIHNFYVLSAKHLLHAVEGVYLHVSRGRGCITCTFIPLIMHNHFSLFNCRAKVQVCWSLFNVYGELSGKSYLPLPLLFWSPNVFWGILHQVHSLGSVETHKQHIKFSLLYRSRIEHLYHRSTTNNTRLLPLEKPLF